MKKRRNRIAVIVANDSERNILGALLLSFGFDATVHDSVVSAWKESTARYELVLLDYSLGRAALEDLLRRLDRDSNNRYVPVLVLIDGGQVLGATPWVSEGVDDFIFRPIQENILYARLRSLLRLGDFHERIRRQNVQFRQEMDMARTIQQSMMTNRFPQVGRYTIASRYIPATDLGGDFFDIYAVSGSLFGVFIADVAGHGVQAALLAMIVKGALDAIKKQHYSPAALFAELNSRLVPLFEPLATFVTAFSAIIDVLTGQVIYCSAGHPQQYLLRGERLVELKTGGGLLGLSSSRNFEEKMTDFTQGDVLLLYTDGLVEATDADGEAFGEQRVTDCMLAGRAGTPEEILEELLDRLDTFAAPDVDEVANHDDDVNVIILKAEY